MHLTKTLHAGISSGSAMHAQDVKDWIVQRGLAGHAYDFNVIAKSFDHSPECYSS